MEKIMERNMKLEHDIKMFDRKRVLRSHRGYWFFKRGQDILLSGIALIVLSPILVLTALAIWIDDPQGSPFFRQIRCGRDGRLFEMYKFRSMYVDAEKRLEELLQNNEMDGPAFKIKNDPRITRVGHFIRKTSIDELPQLWNVLRGDMSLVGPRPALPREVEQYKDIWRQRMYITPGLTCFWQIAPHRNDISFSDWMKLDMKYIEERSIWLDWKIMFMTLKAVVCKHGE